MLTKKLIHTMVVLGLLLPLGAFAEQGKIAVFDLQRALVSTNYAKERVAAYQARKDYKDMSENFTQLRAEGEALQKKYEKDGQTMSAEQQGELRKKLEYKRAEMELLGKKAQADTQTILKEITDKLMPKAKEIVDQMIKADGYGVVLDAKGVYYADKTFDITDRVTQKLNSSVGK